ncbi:MAG: M20 family metallopeptidase [Ilumatobacter sp.]|nr:M20 family metallopeptidase [Ilumatobacter sp.]MCB0984540.1 M20 family metallopeptidase [Ilumatobacter sp.]
MTTSTHPDRAEAVERAVAALDDGEFVADLARRVAIHSESPRADAGPDLHAYLADELVPSLQRLGFETALHHNPTAGAGPLLTAHRHEGDHLPTVLMYAHGDVVGGMADRWTKGAGPWTLHADGDRLYGRGTADNKGQHTVNLTALAAVLAVRGRLGCNVTWLVETGEETGSPGLAEFCATHRDALRADVLIASDGPRQRCDLPTLFLGSRGVADIELSVRLREGAHHSGNWGGLLRNPGTVLANTIACLVDGNGVIQVPELRPPPISAGVRAALAGLTFGGGDGEPAVDDMWGEPGLTPAERVIAWNTLEVLAMVTGNPARPVNAIPPTAWAKLHLRHVVGTDVSDVPGAVRRHLARHGITHVEVSEAVISPATRLDPDDPWVQFTAASVERTTGRPPVILPNLGGTIPNDVFADVLGLPTVWVPHSYAGCNQHAPDEHLLLPVAREGLAIMAGLFWDLADARP